MPRTQSGAQNVNSSNSQPLNFILLGGCKFQTRNGVDLTPRGRKSRALVAYLAVSPEGRATRERLAGLLWSDRGDEQARGSLRQSLKEIRSAFASVDPTFLTINRETVQLNLGTVSIDALRLEQAGSQDCIEGLHQSHAIPSGDFLENLGAISPSFDEWLFYERQRRRRTLQTLLEGIVRHSIEHDDYALAERVAQQLLVIDPADEGAHRALIRTYAKRGDRAVALRQFQACREILERELGTEPERETCELVDRIRARVGGQASTNSVDPDPPNASIQVKRPEDPQHPETKQKPSIAVLPLANLTGESEENYLCDGITDDIITSLSKFRELFVVAKHSTAVYRQTAVDATEVARRLDVDYVLDGSLRRHGNQLRINVQLIDGSARQQVWAERYDAVNADVIGVVDELLAKIVGILLPVVEAALAERLRQRPTPDLRAYECYLRGKHLIENSFDSDHARQAQELLEKAIDLDPNLTIAYNHLVRLYNTEMMGTVAGTPRREAWDRALTLASTAITRDPADPHAHIAIGWCYLRRRQFQRAEVHFERALALNPYDADRITYAATGFLCLGNHELALELMQKALAVNPYHPETYVADLAEVYFMLRRYDEAAELYETISNRPPHRAAWKAANLAQMGAIDEARIEAEEFLAQVGAIWAGKPDAGPADFVQWLLDHSYPLYTERDSTHLRSGLGLAGLPV